MASPKISYNRGTSATYGVSYTAESGVAGATVLFTVKEDVDNSSNDATALVEKTIAMTANEASIELDPADIAVTYDEGDYVYDIKVIDANGDIWLVAEGTFALNVSATNRTS